MLHKFLSYILFAIMYNLLDILVGYVSGPQYSGDAIPFQRRNLIILMNYFQGYVCLFFYFLLPFFRNFETLSD